jgi:hypothetical protein
LDFGVKHGVIFFSGFPFLFFFKICAVCNRSFSLKF